MTGRRHLYVAFDGDEDIRWYYLLKAWRDNKRMDFTFNDAHDLNVARDSSLTESIKVQLRSRMQQSRCLLLLVGAKTATIRGYIPWEISYARHLDLPIVVSNINDERSYDSSRCPSALPGGAGAVHISFEAAIITHAVHNWTEFYYSNRTEALKGTYHYKADEYRRLGL